MLPGNSLYVTILNGRGYAVSLVRVEDGVLQLGSLFSNWLYLEDMAQATESAARNEQQAFYCPGTNAVRTWGLLSVSPSLGISWMKYFFLGDDRPLTKWALTCFLSIGSMSTIPFFIRRSWNGEYACGCLLCSDHEGERPAVPSHSISENPSDKLVSLNLFWFYLFVCQLVCFPKRAWVTQISVKFLFFFI